jgi:hypothetical protein
MAFTPLKDHETPIKVLFTGYLITVGIGYFFALIQILLTHGMADGKFGLSIDDIVYSYYGNRSGTVLEQKLEGSMQDKADDEERFEIIQWVRDGADDEAYKENGIEAIIQKRCVMCHNKDASGIPNFNDFKKLKELAAQDEGATLGSLTRGSHIHMFGISFIFMFVGIIFSFSETTNVKFKCIAVGMPYVFLITDIVSWWLTKFFPMFAWLVILAGIGMGVSFMFMWFTSIMEMWLFEIVYVEGVWPYYQRLKADAKAGRLSERFNPITTKIVALSLAATKLINKLIKKLSPWVMAGGKQLMAIFNNTLNKNRPPDNR